jgi:hypothetical protein
MLHSPRSGFARASTIETTAYGVYKGYVSMFQQLPYLKFLARCSVLRALRTCF